MRLYLSGPITKDPNYERKFQSAAARLRAKGYTAIVNPAELTKVIGHEFEYGEIMNLDLSILAMCDALIQLDGWEESRGASIEYSYALAADKLIISLEAMLEGGGPDGE